MIWELRFAILGELVELGFTWSDLGLDCISGRG